MPSAFGPDGFTFTHGADLETTETARRYDVAINLASMQEMNPPEIARNLRYIRALFYCRNRERKVLPDSTVTAIRNDPWSSTDEIIVNELCPWTQWFVTRRPAFVRRYVGI